MNSRRWKSPRRMHWSSPLTMRACRRRMLSGAFADTVGTQNWFALTGVLCIALAGLMYALPSIRKIDPPAHDHTAESGERR